MDGSLGDIWHGLSDSWMFTVLTLFEQGLNDFFTPDFIACFSWVFLEKAIALIKIQIDCRFCLIYRTVVAVLDNGFRKTCKDTLYNIQELSPSR